MLGVDASRIEIRGAGHAVYNSGVKREADAYRRLELTLNSRQLALAADLETQEKEIRRFRSIIADLPSILSLMPVMRRQRNENMQSSGRRAKAAAAYLGQQGIDMARIKSRGVGGIFYATENAGGADMFRRLEIVAQTRHDM